MKPRIFIGSSVEGLEIANAAQINLQLETEVTVWPQGIFQLSESSLDSLLKASKTFDFALLIFSPDDLVTLRQEENSAVRDNVVLELGIFMNQLGRQRVFIVVPEGSTDLRIPTDLIGVSPGYYETGRSDGNVIAATAPVCYQIKKQIAELGSLDHGEESTGAIGIVQNTEVADDAVAGVPAISEADAASETEEHWIEAYLDRRFDDAIRLLEKRLTEESDPDQTRVLECWIGRAEYGRDWAKGTSYLESMIEKYPNDEDPYTQLAYAHILRNQFQPAIDVIDMGLAKVTDRLPLLAAKSACYNRFEMADLAVATMKEAIVEFPVSYGSHLALADHFIKNDDYDDARSVLENGIVMVPNNEYLLSTYGKLLFDHFEPREALVPYSDLVFLFPDSANYRTLRGNTYLKLDLNDLTMQDYRHAAELAAKAGENEAWILANIGNLLKNRGIYEDGIEYLNRAIEIEPSSSYSHQRLATARDLQTEEKEKSVKILEEAKISLSVRMLPDFDSD